jgi:hypothetical protein
VRRRDFIERGIFINLLEVGKENWSFGRGIAQYVTAA